MNTVPIGLPEILIVVAVGALYAAYRMLSRPTNG